MNIEDFEIGVKAEIRHRITTADIDRFVALTGDNNPLHTDADYAKNTSFKKPVVHGMLGASFISTIIGTKLPGEGALWFSQQIEFLQPVRIGDEITVKAEVLKIDKRQSILELKTDIFNQHKQKVVDGRAKVKLVAHKVERKEVKGKVKAGTVVIFGASGGIGRALVEKLAGSGMNLALHYHSNKKELQELRSKHKLESRSILVTGDVQSIQDVREICDAAERKFGSIEAVVNCTTGFVPNMDFNDLEWEDFQKHIDVHLKGSFNIMKAVVPAMAANKYGKIVHITTQAIEYPFSNLMPYITAKSGLHGMSKSAAVDLAKKGIRVNMVSPGITDTDLNADLPEKVKLVTEAKTPMKRLAQPEDVASAIAYLISPESDFLTGETIRVNGGQIMI